MTLTRALHRAIKDLDHPSLKNFAQELQTAYGEPVTVDGTYATLLDSVLECVSRHDVATALLPSSTNSIIQTNSHKGQCSKGGQKRQKQQQQKEAMGQARTEEGREDEPQGRRYNLRSRDPRVVEHEQEGRSQEGGNDEGSHGAAGRDVEADRREAIIRALKYRDLQYLVMRMREKHGHPIKATGKYADLVERAIAYYLKHYNTTMGGNPLQHHEQEEAEESMGSTDGELTEEEGDNHVEGELESVEGSEGGAAEQEQQEQLERPALVLGMIRLTCKALANLTNKGYSGTSVSAVRDTVRIQSLEEQLGTAVYSIASPLPMGSVMMETNPDLHLPGNFGRRLVKELRNLVGQGVVLGAVYGDYYRFPSHYFCKAYKPFVNSMLPAMIKEGLVDQHTAIVLPMVNPKHDTDGATYEYLKTAGLFHCQDLDPQENALYEATDAPHLQAYLNASNHDEINTGTYRRPKPFARFTLV